MSAIESRWQTCFEVRLKPYCEISQAGCFTASLGLANDSRLMVAELSAGKAAQQPGVMVLNRKTYQNILNKKKVG
ncbi:hypothetical protein AALA98_07980 [Lachnospiraceae bacterium 45-W7]